MKNNINSKVRSFDDLPLWAMIASATGVMIGIAISFPLLYVWIMGLVACVGILVGMVTFLGAMSDSPIYLIFFSRDVVEGSFRLIGVILVGLVGLSE